MKHATSLLKPPLLALFRRLPAGVKSKIANLAVLTMDEPERDLFREHYRVPSVEWTLRNMRRLGFQPRRVVDIGAYIGDWTRMVKCVFPEEGLLVHMIEAQASKTDDLDRVAQELDGVSFEIALLGRDERSAVMFFELETGSGVLEEQSSVPRTARMCPMKTLDDVLKAKNWGAVGLLKIDVQGYEIEVLEGSLQTLATTEAVLLEVSLIAVNKGAPLMHEVVAFMDEQGFAVYDICSFVRRPLDKALWQCDIMFVKRSSALLASSAFD